MIKLYGKSKPLSLIDDSKVIIPLVSEFNLAENKNDLALVTDGEIYKNYNTN